MPERNSEEPSSSCRTVRERLEQLRSREAAELPPLVVPSHFQKAAVVLLVGCSDAHPFLILSERAENMRAHPAEVCLPGGRVEQDESDEDAAVREAVEELSVDSTLVEVMGKLDQAWSRAGNVVTPIVAWYAGSPSDLRPNQREVARVLVADLIALTNVDARREQVVSHHGRDFTNDVLVAGDFEIYGLTADIVLDLVGWITGSDRRRTPARANDLAFLFRTEQT
jgi:8-oxo-dGTP pyrophosphatase MutT (NUDIX family)